MKQLTGKVFGDKVAGNFFHQPVLRDQVLSLWVTDPNGVYIDATVGGGGHAEALLHRLGPNGLLVGIDRDANAIAFSSRRLATFKEQIRLHVANFTDIVNVIRREGFMQVHGVLADLGVSSHQIETPSRGFSYRFDGPLDMRMHQQGVTTARELVNTCTADELGDILKNFGEERNARRIARAIVRARDIRPLALTSELADIVRKNVPQQFAVKSLSRVFQALRIAVNKEISALMMFLSSIPQILIEGGRWVMIAYHSLEDRPIKYAFRYYCKGGDFPEGMDTSMRMWEKGFHALTGHVIRPDRLEIDENPRARSARVRAIEKLAAEKTNI